MYVVNSYGQLILIYGCSGLVSDCLYKCRSACTGGIFGGHVASLVVYSSNFNLDPI